MTKVRSFRLSMNMARFNGSAARISLPEVDGFRGAEPCSKSCGSLSRWTNTSFPSPRNAVIFSNVQDYLITGWLTRRIANQKCGQ